MCAVPVASRLPTHRSQRPPLLPPAVVSHDPTRPEIVGLNWVRQGAQWDIAHKHGDLASCIQKGQEAGHIQAPSKRSWAQCEAASSSPMSMPDDRKHASD